MKKTEKQDDEIIVRLTNFDLQRIYEALDNEANRLASDVKENDEAFQGFKCEDYDKTLAKISEYVSWY